MEPQDVRRQWDTIAPTYAARRDPDGPDAELLEELLGSLPEEPRVLDIGPCDGARTLANLPSGSIGLDISRDGLELAADRVPEAALLHGEMGHLPVAESTVDAITAYHAVFHVDRKRHPEVYREFARVLRPGGRLLMTLPTGRYDTVRSGWMGGRMQFSAPGDERTLTQLREAGFTDTETVTTDDPLGSSTEFVFATRS